MTASPPATATARRRPAAPPRVAHRARAASPASRCSASAWTRRRRSPPGGHHPVRPVPRPDPRPGPRLPRRPGRARAELLPAAALGRPELHPPRRLHLRGRPHPVPDRVPLRRPGVHVPLASLTGIEVWYSPATARPRPSRSTSRCSARSSGSTSPVAPGPDLGRAEPARPARSPGQGDKVLRPGVPRDRPARRAARPAAADHARRRPRRARRLAHGPSTGTGTRSPGCRRSGSTPRPGGSSARSSPRSTP